MKTTKLSLRLLVLWLPLAVYANPQGLTVQSGSASVTVNGNQYNITASHNAFLNWQSFNIAAGETTRFIQPSAASVVWNQINDANPSQIYGNLTANGVVVLMNRSGFYFGPNSFVSAAGLIVSTAPFVPAEGGGGLFWQFTGPPPSASIINYGQFNVGPGGSAFLIAERIENHGTITAAGGNIGLIAGQEVLLSERPDGRGLSASVTLPSGSVNNSGDLIADAGTIALQARVVNQNGLVQANSIRERNGIIELIAAESITLGENSLISASGDSIGDDGEIASLLKLEAGHDILFENEAKILAGDDWSVILQAGRDFSLADTVISGTGNILFSGNSSLEARNGNISLLAGNDITVGAGHVRTVNGGSIAATALGGSINAGTKANGFSFSAAGYTVHPDLGGISTANGGNVNLTAGLDVVSYMPTSVGAANDAGSGAFGAAPGNVSITAGRNVIGHYVVRNGVGNITAVNAGTRDNGLLALSLVSGGWTVNAANDIWLQEVRNPNGVFNSVGSSSSPNRFRFDYSPDAYTRLHAGNAVQLRGTPLPRYTSFAQSIPPIYPGTLEITAGAGGVVLGNDLILFPSPSGDLRISTTAGGSLVGTKNTGLTQLIMSDSGKTRFTQTGDFGLSDHAAIPVHLNDPDPIRLNIDGDMSGILLGAAKRAEVNVGGDMINSRFDGQNLHDTDTTSINVAGDIINRNEFTSVASPAPNFRLFDPLLNLIYPPLVGSVAGVENQFFYNELTGELTFQGRMTGEQLQTLLNLRVRAFDQNGLPLFHPDGEPQTVHAEFVSPTVLQQLYVLSQDVPLNPQTGYRIGGGGTFIIMAHNLDLGATVGIVSRGPSGNTALANYFTEGADINVILSGNLDMFSTKIASVNGGDINVYAEGYVSVGSRTFTSGGLAARGIFTLDDSDVTVIARGDINVNGSRIAAYDGGNILVRSLEGDVDAGTGGTGAAEVEKVYVDPTTRAIRTSVATIPGSGILATTFPPSLSPLFPPSQNTVGNILVETPQGDIIASSGGIVQVPLNAGGDNSSRKAAIEFLFGGFLREVLGIDTSKLLVVPTVTSGGTVTLRAGSLDEDGNVIYVGNIDTSGAGVIGSTVRLEASGDIKGLVFARDNLDIDANQNVNVTALAVGSANVSAGDTISGTIIGVGSVNASGSSVDASLLSQNVTASGDVTSSQVGFAQANAAAATSQGLQADDSAKEAASGDKKDEEDELKKNRPGPRIAKTAGRVTVILPEKKS